MASPVEQAILELQSQPEDTQTQLKTLAENHDLLKKASPAQKVYGA